MKFASGLPLLAVSLASTQGHEVHRRAIRYAAPEVDCTYDGCSYAGSFIKNLSSHSNMAIADPCIYTTGTTSGSTARIGDCSNDVTDETQRFFYGESSHYIHLYEDQYQVLGVATVGQYQKVVLQDYDGTNTKQQWTRNGDKFQLVDTSYCLGVSGSAGTTTAGKQLELHPCSWWSKASVGDALDWEILRQEACSIEICK